MYKSLFPELERGRPSGNDDTTAGGLVATQRLCIIFLTYKKIYSDSHHCSRQHRQRKELAQHTVMRPHGRCRHVTVTTMVYAIGALRLCRLTSFMDVNRRQYQHWHKHCQ